MLDGDDIKLWQTRRRRLQERKNTLAGYVFIGFILLIPASLFFIFIAIIYDVLKHMPH